MVYLHPRGQLGSPAGTLTPTSLTLGGGASGLVTLQVNAYPGLPSGIYPIVVQANDTDYIPPVHPSGANNSTTFIVDGFPPTAPTNLQSTVDAQGKVTLTWDPASDTLSGVQTYIVKRNNVEIGRTPSLSYIDNTALQGSNTYVVGAMDGVGNTTFSDSSVTTNWPPPPTVTITAPANGAALTTDQSITFTGTATSIVDGNLDARLRWTSSLDGVIGNGGSFTRTLSAGFHTLTVQATDNHNVTGAAVLTINIIRPTTLTLNSLSTEDGWVLESAANSGVGGSIKSSDTTSKALLFGDSSKKQQYKSILSFDTAALPNNATITSATLRVQRGTLSGNRRHRSGWFLHHLHAIGRYPHHHSDSHRWVRRPGHGEHYADQQQQPLPHRNHQFACQQRQLHCRRRDQLHRHGDRR